MLKRIFACTLAVILIFLCCGCGAKSGIDPAGTTGEDGQVAPGSKIALIGGHSSQEQELATALAKLSKIYHDGIIQIGYPVDYQTDDTALSKAVEMATQDEAVKAVIFTNGVLGTAKAAAHVRELREDMCIVVCNPLEGIDSVRLTANLVFSLDFTAYVDALIQNAKQMGAENLIFYTTDREMQLPVLKDLRTAVEKGCKAQKITCKAAASVDYYEKGNSVETAKAYLSEDTERKLEKYGAKTALFSTDLQMQGTMASVAVARGMVMPATFLPSPIALTFDLGLDINGHESDSAFALQSLQDAAASNGTKGRVATWRFSEPMVTVMAALAYAVDVTNGNAGLRVDAEQINAYVRAQTDAEFTFTDSGFNNVFLFSSTPVTL